MITGRLPLSIKVAQNQRFPIESIREQFPMLEAKAHGKPLVYLDSAATSLKPMCVTEAMNTFTHASYSTVSRGSHWYADQATELFEESRCVIRKFFGAEEDYELIFTAGATDALNLAAFGYASDNLKAGDRVLISPYEHHSNYLPWRYLVKEKGIQLDVIELDSSGQLRLDDLHRQLQLRPKVVAFTHTSNVFGLALDVQEMTRLAHEIGAVVILDAAQGAPHTTIKLSELGSDMLAVSAHKMLGPTGIGGLIVRREILDRLHPIRFGGGAVYRITDQAISFKPGVQKFEAGTQNIVGAIGWAAAVSYLDSVGMDAVGSHLLELTKIICSILDSHHGITILCPAVSRCTMGPTSFLVERIHPHDVGSYLDREGIAIRVGNLCCQPLLRRLGLSSVSRISPYIYNDKADLERLDSSLGRMLSFFGKYQR